MDSQRKTVQIYLRIKGPQNDKIRPQFKLFADNTKIRFKQQNQTEQESIINQFKEQGVYKFQKIFRQNAKQEDIYNRVAQDLVQSAIEGYNGTIFAYGQTGSGKTYTMTGGDDDPQQMGIIPRIINELYGEAETREQQIQIKLKYMQIYKKNGYDLLAPSSKSKKLQQLPQVRPFCKADNFQFQNLSEHVAPTFEQAMKIYQYGDTNRIVCKTPNNDQSSRSHCIFMIGIRTKNKDTGLQQKATINLVDLAGSERIHFSGMEEKQAKQGISINLGLHYLGRVVISLGQQSRGNPDMYIPYRDSLLTMALKSSMGGNCKTRMIATINPNPVFNPQNIATCKFSQNLLAMQNKLKKNQFINPWDIIKGLKNQVQQLKGQISRLKGENVKQILERADYIKIHKMVDQFIASTDPAATLPINDRLFIREYLSYMKHMLKNRPRMKTQNQNNENNEYFSTAISQNYIVEVKNLKQQIQQKQNQIQLLLSLINNQKQENPQSIQENFIPIEQSSQMIIAQTVVNSLMKNKKKKISVTAEQVQKNLIKPLLLNKQDSVEQAFQKFKESHVKTEEIDQREHQIKLKSMKKQIIQKKLKNLRNQRNKINQRLQQLTKIQIKSGNLPSLNQSQNKNIQIKEIQKQLQDIDEKLKKKYQQLKSIQLQINRLGLCKNKNTQKLKNQFQQYMEDKIQNQKNQGQDMESIPSEASQKIHNKIKEFTQKVQKIPKTENSNVSSQRSQKNSQDRTRINSAMSNRIKTNVYVDLNKQQQTDLKYDEKEVDKQMQEFYAAKRNLYKNEK